MLMTPLSLLSLFLLSTSSYAVPLSRREVPTLRVVTNEDGSGFACTSDQVESLQAALDEAASLAKKAATALSQPGAETSDAFTKWLGDITATKLDLKTQVTMRFTNPAEAFESELTKVADPGIDDALYFFCPDETDAGKAFCDDGQFAETSNKLDGNPVSAIALCDRFFTPAATLAADKDAYQNSVAAGGATTVNFRQPQSRGVTLVHEAQHSLPLLQSTNEDDNLEDLPNTNTPEGASNLLNPQDKQTNAENWAILAFLAEVDPARLEACDTSSGSTSKRAVGSSKGGAVCPLRSNGNTSSSSGTTSAPKNSTPSVPAKPPKAPVKSPKVPAKPPKVPTKPPKVPAKPPKVPAKPPKVPVKPPKVPVKPSKLGKKGIKLIGRL